MKCDQLRHFALEPGLVSGAWDVCAFACLLEDEPVSQVSGPRASCEWPASRASLERVPVLMSMLSSDDRMPMSGRDCADVAGVESVAFVSTELSNFLSAESLPERLLSSSR